MVNSQDHKFLICLKCSIMCKHQECHGSATTGASLVVSLAVVLQVGVFDGPVAHDA